MSQIIQLRQKIRAVQGTKKITHAIRLVSMSLYGRLDRQNVPLRYHTEKLNELFEELIPAAPGWFSSLLLPEKSQQPNTLYVIIGTSKGLCGSFNSNLFRFINASLGQEDFEHASFIAIGQRVINYLKEVKVANVLSSYSELNTNNYLAIADALLDKIVNAQAPYTSVAFLCNDIKSFFIQKPHRVTLIPSPIESLQRRYELRQFEVSADDLDNNRDVERDHMVAAEKEAVADHNEFICEQNIKDILDYLAGQYLRNAIISTLFQSLRAEYAARFMAMENSTNNAEKYIDQMVLQYNKLRQALITKEVSELSSFASNK